MIFFSLVHKHSLGYLHHGFFYLFSILLFLEILLRCQTYDVLKFVFSQKIFRKPFLGLTNLEIKELDKWIRKNTIEKFGPVRSLKPEMVFEISFDKIQISKRHKSGIAVRFPRITKWRKDKKINDADSLENAYELMKKIS